MSVPYIFCRRGNKVSKIDQQREPRQNHEIHGQKYGPLLTRIEQVRITCLDNYADRYTIQSCAHICTYPYRISFENQVIASKIIVLNIWSDSIQDVFAGSPWCQVRHDTAALSSMATICFAATWLLSWSTLATSSHKSCGWTYSWAWTIIYTVSSELLAPYQHFLHLV